jgi:hypothetical protein
VSAHAGEVIRRQNEEDPEAAVKEGASRSPWMFSVGPVYRSGVEFVMILPFKGSPGGGLKSRYA